MAATPGTTDAPGGRQSRSVVAVEQALLANPLVAPWLEGAAPGTLWLAFSGGLDSTVLAHALRRVPGARAVHVDHGLVAASAQWSRHCAEMAAEFGLPIRREAVEVARRGNLEAAARAARYARWRALLGPRDVLALAHHAHDQAETRLWQLLTGREPVGMPTERALGAGRLARPFLVVRRNVLADYAARCRLRWIEDPSNEDLGRDRNYIRHALLPRIERRFPEGFEKLIAPRATALGIRRPLAVKDATAAKARAWLLESGLSPAPRAVAEIARQNAAPSDRQPQVGVVPGVRARRYDGAWRLVSECARAAAVVSVTAGCEQRLGDGRLTWRGGRGGLAVGRILTVRQRQGGERLRPAGRQVRKTVKALFQEHRVPPWQRGVWPLLFDDDRLVAVAGLAVAAEAVVADGVFPIWSPDAD